LVALAGVALVIPALDWHNAFSRGALWGTISGLTFAGLSIANRGYRARYPALALTFHQALWAILFLLPVVTGTDARPTARDRGLLVLLGVVFTALAHGLFIGSLRRVRARVASVVATLEPVYGIVLAALLLREFPGGRTLAGGAVIVAAAGWVTLRGGGEAPSP
jgi:drug/metabolite transporter (DMT)-like permease